jgi:hypothetical protein
MVNATLDTALSFVLFHTNVTHAVMLRQSTKENPLKKTCFSLGLIFTEISFSGFFACKISNNTLKINFSGNA